jgi:hypothetical protein
MQYTMSGFGEVEHLKKIIEESEKLASNALIMKV